MVAARSVKTLKELSRRFPSTEEMHLMVIGLSKQGNHRALAITLTALLERALEEYIASALTWPPGETEAEKERKDFFRSDAPFATFAAKTRLGFLLGLYNS